MNLTKLSLKNYRRFPQLDIDFHPMLTVIAARNGQGKTSVLEAIVAALGPFVGAFDQGISKHIEQTDARYARVGEGFENEPRFPVVINAEMLTPDVQWGRSLNGSKSRTTTKDAEPLAAWGREFQSMLRTSSEVTLPVICYYSSRRLWASRNNLSKKAVLTESRTAGYENCLSVFSDFAQLQKWMAQATYAALQQQQRSGYEHSSLSAQLQGISDAVNEELEELASWDESDRNDYLRGEIEVTRWDPFASTIRHFLQNT